MIGEDAVALKMEAIKEIAIQAQYDFATSDDLNAILQAIEQVDQEFRLVAYEAAAMMIAKKDFDEGIGIIRWKEFLKKINPIYAPHAYIGLGWTVAKTKKYSFPFVNDIPEQMKFRIMDGRGYFDGLFLARGSWMIKKHPMDITEIWIAPYYQGIGRSLLYHCNGSVAKVALIIKGFSPDRQQDLWRGVGIAVPVIGSFNKELLDYTFQTAFPNHPQLIVGAALAVKSRFQLKAMTDSCLLVSETWCNQSPQDCFLLIRKIEESILPGADFYKSLINGIRNEFSDIPIPEKKG
jgi:Protein of unknown function (DUF1702)